MESSNLTHSEREKIRKEQILKKNKAKQKAAENQQIIKKDGKHL